METSTERRARSRARVTRALAESLGWAGFTHPGLPGRIAVLLRGNPALGSRDRRIQREALFLIARFLPWWRSATADDLPRCAELAAELAANSDTAAAPGPAEVAATCTRICPGFQADPAALLPDWMRDEAPECFAGQRPLWFATRPPVWLRSRRGRREAALRELDALGFDPRPHPLHPDAIRIAPGRDVTSTNAFALGCFEVQDLGSQMLLAHVNVASGERWLDACAGAGGKTLQLAEYVGPAGWVEAADIRSAALHELRARRTRAGLFNIGVHFWKAGGVERLDAPADLPPGPVFDGVLVDAPCTGTGTWRRNPHLRWSLSPAAVAEHAARQLSLLQAHAGRVRPGGQLVYATCSLCRSENEAVLEAFLAGHPEFRAARPEPLEGCERAGDGVRIPPWAHDNDGFFLGVLRRKS